MKSKRFYPFFISIAVVLSFIVLTGCCRIPHITIHTNDASQIAYQLHDTDTPITAPQAQDIPQAMHKVFDTDTPITAPHAQNTPITVPHAQDTPHVTDQTQDTPKVTHKTQDTSHENHQQKTSGNLPAQQDDEQQALNPSVGEHGNRSSNTAISLERAIEIANSDLASRGISATYSSNSGLDWEKGQRVWELLFRTHGERMPLIEYYINTENGSIVKFEWDD